MSRSRSSASRARERAPRGGGGSGAGFRLRPGFGAGLRLAAGLRSGKQALHGGGDAAAFGAAGEARGGRLHDLSEALRPLRPDFGDHRAKLAFELVVAERRRQIATDELGLGLLPLG